MSGGGKSQVVGYRYYFGVHMGVGRGPVDALKEIRVGDRTAWLGDVRSNQTFAIDAYDLFGGEEKEGGVQGTLDVMFGEPDQIASSGLRAMLGEGISGFRRMFTLFFDGIVSMNNPYPKPWKMRINRTFKGWDGPVFQPSYAAISVAEGSQTFSTVVLDMPLNAPGAENRGSAAVLLPERFPTNPLNYDGTGMVLQVGDELEDQVTPDSFSLPGGFYFWNVADVDVDRFQRLEQFIEVDGYDLSVPGSYVRAYEGTIGFNTGFGYQDIYTLIESGTFGGSTPQFRVEVSGGEGIGTEFHLIGNPSKLNIRLVHDFVLRRSTIFVNGAQIAYRNFRADTISFNDLRLLNLRGNPARFSNYRVIGYTTTEVSAMNPAHIIYECLTNREWGRGLARSKIDEASFTAAAIKLFSENFGLCLKWTRKDSIENFVQLVLDHIGAVLYQSRITGLMTLKLIRDDYDPDTLPTYTTENGLVEIRKNDSGSPAKTVNAITVKWKDQLRDQERTVSVRNTASILSNGGAVNAATKDYIGVPSASLALRLAQRDLRAVSTNIDRFTCVFDQRIGVVHPADVFAIEDPKRGIPRTIVRVGKVRDGTIVDGKINVEAVQDQFGLPATSFAVEVPNTYTPPDTRPCVAEQRAFEVPYFLLARTMTAAELDYVKDDGGYFAAVAGKGKPTSQGVELAVRESPPTSDDNPLDPSYICDI